jgi:hypothetical protein
MSERRKALEDIEARVQHSLGRGRELATGAWAVLKKRPVLGTGLAIAGGLGLATMLGAAEVAVAMSAGLLGYQALAGRGHSATGASERSAAD